MSSLLPLFYFKPSICWVDDDECLLDAVNITLNDKYNCLTFNDPENAIAFFNSRLSPLSNIKLKRELTESDISGMNGRFPVDLNISAIRNIASLKDKNHEMAVIIVDYNMPHINGIDFCKKLKDIPAKKILLTGEATHENAIEAFNNGLIDRFIKKDINIFDKICDYIDELVSQYFKEQSSFLISHIEASRPSVFSDEIFIDFFDEWCKLHQIEEYYLINKDGCYLLKDSNNKKYYFIVMSETIKNEFLCINNELSAKTEDLLSEVRSGKKIPFFGIGRESWEFDTGEWKEYFYPAQTISGRENYYWTAIEDNE